VGFFLFIYSFDIAFALVRISLFLVSFLPTAGVVGERVALKILAAFSCAFSLLIPSEINLSLIDVYFLGIIRAFVKGEAQPSYY